MHKKGLCVTLRISVRSGLAACDRSKRMNTQPPTNYLDCATLYCTSRYYFGLRYNILHSSLLFWIAIRFRYLSSRYGDFHGMIPDCDFTIPDCDSVPIYRDCISQRKRITYYANVALSLLEMKQLINTLRDSEDSAFARIRSRRITFRRPGYVIKL